MRTRESLREAGLGSAQRELVAGIALVLLLTCQVRCWSSFDLGSSGLLLIFTGKEEMSS